MFDVRFRNRSGTVRPPPGIVLPLLHRIRAGASI
jgi:hypothetical protein